MDARIQIQKPDEIKVTITATMSLGEWEKISDALKESKNWDNNPMWGFRKLILEILQDLKEGSIWKYAEKKP